MRWPELISEGRLPMSEHHLKLAALQEYEMALRFRKSQEEILEAFQGLLREFMDYCAGHGYAIPDPEKYRRILGRSIALLESQASPEMLHPSKSPEDDTEPLGRFCFILWVVQLGASFGAVSAALSRLSHLSFPSIPIPALSAGVWPSKAA